MLRKGSSYTLARVRTWGAMENHAPIALMPAWNQTRSTSLRVSVVEWPHMRADDIATPSDIEYRHTNEYGHDHLSRRKGRESQRVEGMPTCIRYGGFERPRCGEYPKPT